MYMSSTVCSASSGMKFFKWHLLFVLGCLDMPFAPWHMSICVIVTPISFQACPSLLARTLCCQTAGG